MDDNNRPNHIEDALAELHTGQWFGWANSKKKLEDIVYADLILHPKCYVDGEYKDNPYSKPTESELNTKLKSMQDAWDLQNDSYKSKRRAEYPSVEDQLDDLYHNGIDGWKTTIKAVKDKHSKG